MCMLLLGSAGRTFAQATGTIRGTVKAERIGTESAVQGMIEALNATDATVAGMALVNNDESFTLSLPAGAYRIAFRFKAALGEFSSFRSFYNEAPSIHFIYCFSEGTIVNVVESETVTLDAYTSYNIDPRLIVSSYPKLTGAVTDASGRPLPDITVDVMDDCNANVIGTAQSDVDGTFCIPQKVGTPLAGAAWKVRFLDPAGRYATSFYEADDFINAPLVTDLDMFKVLQLRPPDIAVSPLIYDFGDVALPGASTAGVSIENRGGADLLVTSLGLAGGAASPIAILSAPTLPLTLAGGESRDVILQFEPHALATFTDRLVIGSDDPDETTVSVSLSGSGVASLAPPAEQVAATLQYIAVTVADGTLQGVGPGASGSAHVQALMSQIKAASDLAASGKLQQACQQLDNARQRTDGDPNPPDFVEGPAAAELSLLIDLTHAAIGCR